MGRSGSTSKRKSSKKKTFKISSEARRKKRSRRNKSRNLARSDDSISSFSEDESTSSSLVSSSSSESDYKSRRERSRVKGSRRRSRRRSSSPESDDSLRVKKRKRSKRKDDSETKKKKKKKNKKTKKPKREANISLTSSGSRSCSTCQGRDSSSDEESEVEFLHRPGKREKKKDNKDSSKDRRGNRDRKHRSRSSSYSKLSHNDGHNSVEELAVENNPRRLRSVIIVARPEVEKEECQANKDEPNEEIFYEYDDYPSCRSNDSNDAGNKRELADPYYLSSEKRSRVENLMLEVDSMSTIKSSKANSPAKNGIDGSGSIDAKEEETKVSAVGSDTDDLESILRQKALENLSRFRGRLQSKEVSPVNEKTDTQSGEKKFPAANIELVENKLLKHDGSSSTAIGAPQLVVPRSRFTWKRDPSVASKTEQKITKSSGFDAETTKHIALCLPSKACISGGNEEKEQVTSGSAVNYESESIKSRALEPKLHMLPKADLSLTSIAEDTPNAVAEINKISDGVGISDALKSTALETPASVSAEEHSSKEQQETETKDSSQFEQKTMSVMRGGELVQVSYKVYIPKKAPALARRKLKR